jgi:hypothetical protein
MKEANAKYKEKVEMLKKQELELLQDEQLQQEQLLPPLRANLMW